MKKSEKQKSAPARASAAANSTGVQQLPNPPVQLKRDNLLEWTKGLISYLRRNKYADLATAIETNEIPDYDSLIGEKRAELVEATKQKKKAIDSLQTLKDSRKYTEEESTKGPFTTRITESEELEERISIAQEAVFDAEALHEVLKQEFEIALKDLAKRKVAMQESIDALFSQLLDTYEFINPTKIIQLNQTKRLGIKSER